MEAQVVQLWDSLESPSAINHSILPSLLCLSNVILERENSRQNTPRKSQGKCQNQTRGYANRGTVICHPKPSTANPSWTSISISTRPGPWTRSPSSPTLCPPSSSPPPTSPALRSGPSPTMPTRSLPLSAPAAVFVSRSALGFLHVSFGLPSLSLLLVQRFYPL